MATVGVPGFFFFFWQSSNSANRCIPLGIWLTAVDSKHKSVRLLPAAVCHCHSCSGALEGNLLSEDLKGAAAASARQHVADLSIDERGGEQSLISMAKKLSVARCK